LTIDSAYEVDTRPVDEFDAMRKACSYVRYQRCVETSRLMKTFREFEIGDARRPISTLFNQGKWKVLSDETSSAVAKCTVKSSTKCNGKLEGQNKLINRLAP